MKTMFSKILLAQVVAVLLALVVVTVITRATLNQGFKHFLEMQETRVLQTLVPVVGDVYETNGGWDFLRENPMAWQRIWRLSHPGPGAMNPHDPRPRRGRARENQPIPDGTQTGPQPLRWMRMPERGMLRERLFLLDANRVRVAGAPVSSGQESEFEAIEVNGQVVGWIGFTPMGQALPPEAERFLRGQIWSIAVAFAVALIVAAGLAFLLARNVSRPVRILGVTIGKLSRGDYQARASVKTGDEMGVLAGHVNELAGTLEKNRTARQRWVADIAHELRTPVSILKGEVEALRDGIRQADGRMSASLGEEIDQLSTLIDDLQTLALSDAGSLTIKKEPLDLTGLVSQGAELYRERLAKRGISVDLQLEEPVNIKADQNRLRQLIQNLLENTSRYVDENGRVRLTLQQDQGVVSLVLEDSGPGLTEEQRGRLFERFYRVEGSRSRATGGTGLGLPICKNIVEAHNGSIRVEPSGLGGLKIEIILPA